MLFTHYCLSYLEHNVIKLLQYVLLGCGVVWTDQANKEHWIFYVDAYH